MMGYFLRHEMVQMLRSALEGALHLWWSVRHPIYAWRAAQDRSERQWASAEGSEQRCRWARHEQSSWNDEE